MSTSTNFLGLFKPELSDPADITGTNPNWDKLDEELFKKAGFGENAVDISYDNLITAVAGKSGFYRGERVTNAPLDNWWYYVVVADVNTTKVIAFGENNEIKTAQITASSSTITWSDVAKSSLEVLSTMSITTAALIQDDNTVKNYMLPYESYYTIDLPNSNYREGAATVYKYSDGDATIVLWGTPNAPQIAINQYDCAMGEWSGWSTSKGIVLTSGIDYGTSFPTTNLKVGRLFFKKVN